MESANDQGVRAPRVYLLRHVFLAAPAGSREAHALGNGDGFSCAPASADPCVAVVAAGARHESSWSVPGGIEE